MAPRGAGTPAAAGHAADRRAPGLRRGLLARLAAGSIGALFGSLVSMAQTPAPAISAYRPAQEAPAEWQRFAQRLQAHFRDRLQADNGEAGRRLSTFLLKRRGVADLPTLKLVVRTWVATDGAVERVDVGGLDDRRVRADLTSILGRGNVGMAPPADMLQPVAIGLTLDRPEG